MNNNIGNLILKRRKELNMTQEQLAQKLFVSRKVVSRWELNERVPNTIIVKELCDVLQISINEFYLGLNYNFEQRDKLQTLKILKRFVCFSFLGSFALFMFMMILLNIEAFIAWDQVYIDVLWLEIIMSLGVGAIEFLISSIVCLIYYINRSNNIKNKKITFKQIIIIIFSIICIISLIILYINISFKGYNTKNYTSSLLFILLFVIIPSIFFLSFFKIQENKIKRRCNNKQ